ncbi:hypothetical protein Dimus_003862, partial [Dionaea muscipula]
LTHCTASLQSTNIHLSLSSHRPCLSGTLGLPASIVVNPPLAYHYNMQMSGLLHQSPPQSWLDILTGLPLHDAGEGATQTDNRLKELQNVCSEQAAKIEEQNHLWEQLKH